MDLNTLSEEYEILCEEEAILRRDLDYVQSRKAEFILASNEVTDEVKELKELKE